MRDWRRALSQEPCALQLELTTVWGRKRKPEKADQRALVSAFLDAEIKDDAKQVRELLKAGLDLNGRYDGTGRAALHLCAQGGSVKIAEVLIEHGADVRSLDPWGMSTVAIAARWGKTDVLAFFLKSGVDPNLADKDGKTALIHAMCPDEDRADHIRLLLAHGADPDWVDDSGRSARSLAETLSQLVNRAQKGYAALLPPKRDGAVAPPRPAREKPTATDLGVRIATTSERLPDARLLADMFEVGQDLAMLAVHKLVPGLKLPRGRLVATDYLDVLDGKPFAVKLAPGEYGVYLVRAPESDAGEGAAPKGAGTQQRIAFARVQFTKESAIRWEPAQLLGLPTWYGFGVDHGMAALFDEGARNGLQKLSADVRWPDVFWEATASCGHDWAHVTLEGGSAVICSTGWGDGLYSCYLGIAEDGKPCCLVADFQVVEWRLSAQDEG